MPIRHRLFRCGAALGLAAAIVVPLTVGVTPADRGAGHHDHPHGGGQLGSDQPRLSPMGRLQITEESGPTSSVVFFQVNENYCDTATNTAVFLSYLASGPETNQLFVVAHNLSTRRCSPRQALGELRRVDGPRMQHQRLGHHHGHFGAEDRRLVWPLAGQWPGHAHLPR